MVGWLDRDWGLEAVSCLPFAPIASGVAKTPGKSAQLVLKCS